MKKKFFREIKNENAKGAVLFFAVMLSIVLFTFAAGVLNIATKELNFGTSSKKSNDSFYAADSGVECALFNDMQGKTAFTASSEGKISCFGQDINLNGTYPLFDFVLMSLGSDDKSCAKISVEKNEAVTPMETKIISKGYNMGGGADCNQLGLNSIERVIEVNYTNE